VKIGIVGTGGVANRHLGVLTGVLDCHVVGHVSASFERASAKSERWGGRAYSDVAEMLERELPEAVWVCVTPDRHGSLEGTLIAHRVPFFVEKPLANDLATAERIGAEIEAARLVVGVGYKFRALDTLPRVRELLCERPAQLAIGAWHGPTPEPAWWRDEQRSGGQLVEQATHLVDLARVLLGEPRVLAATSLRGPRSTYPEWSAAQVTAALLDFGDGVPATLTATCLLEGSLAIQLQLFSEGRQLTLTERYLRIETGREPIVEVPVRVDPFLVEDETFLQAVRDGNPRGVLCDYADALATHRAAVAIRAAAG
jgi:myo-inositol 2-dehydrogenase / D-chiro-inositol 1-dehydrogenase